MRHLLPLAIVVLVAHTAHAQRAPVDPCAAANDAYAKRQFREADIPARECEKRARDSRDDKRLGEILLLRGKIADRLDANIDAAHYAAEAAPYALRAADHVTASESYRLLAFEYGVLGDWAAFVDFSNRTFEVKPKKDERDWVNLAEARGWAAMELGDRDESLRQFQDALTRAEKINQAGLIAWIESEYGLAEYRLARNVDGALAHYDRALMLAKQAGDKGRVRNVLNNSGNLFRGPGTWAEAERRYTEGMAAARAEGATDVFLMKNLGIVYRETGRRAEGEQLLRDAVKYADQNGVARIRWQARMELGTLYRNSDPDLASKYFQECLDVLEDVHSNVLLETFSAGALSGAITIYDDPYDLFIDHLMRHGDPERALVISERARARAFLDTMSRARQAIAAQIPADYVTRERQLLADISSRQRQLRSEPDPSAAAALRDALARDESALTLLRVRFANEHPEIAHARYPHLLDAGEIKRLPDDDSVLVEYFVGAESTTMWAVTREGISSVRLPGRADIENQVRRYLSKLASPDNDVQVESGELGGLLLPGGPVPRGRRRLIIVPNGVLNYLPFETLTVDGAFVGQTFAVSYAPSASTLAFLQSRPRRASGNMIAIGDPLIDQKGSSDHRGLSAEHVNLLKPLAYAARELSSVAGGFAGSRLLEGDQASESELRRARLSDASIVHFATHGLIDEDHPDRSGLVLTARDSDDGFLQTREVYGLHLNGALVTLSACRTALGRELSGEGIIGLTRAFMQAGARTVVASLWDVDDASTAEFMSGFYAALADGAPVDAAAQSARALLMHSARYSHPYYWGAFVVNGRAGETIPIKRRSGAAPLTLAATAGLLLAAAVVLLRRVPVR